MASELPFATQSGHPNLVPFASKPPSAADWSVDTDGVPVGLPNLLNPGAPPPKPELKPADASELVRQNTGEEPAGDAPAAEPDDENLFAFGDGATAEWTREQMLAMAEEEDDDDSDLPSDVPEPTPEPEPTHAPAPTVEDLSGEVALLRLQVDRWKQIAVGTAVMGAVIGAGVVLALG